MNRTSTASLTGCLLGMLLSCTPLLAQTPEVKQTQYMTQTEIAPPYQSVVETPTEHVMPPGSLSSWITYARNNCCSGTVSSPPIGSEMYLRVGPSIPLGSSVFSESLDVGWMIQGGVKALFFDRGQNAAWTIDAGLANINNRGGAKAVAVPIQQSPSTAPVNVTVRGLNQTYACIGLGREWYFRGEDGNFVRVGVDGGFRYGSGKADFNEIRHRTDVFYNCYSSVFTDFSIPCGCCTYLLGVRGEWYHTWTGILQRSTSMDGLNILLTTGLQY